MKKLFLRMGDYIRSADKLLALLVLLVCGFGITVLTGVVKSFSSTNSLLIVQLAAMGIGFVAALCLSCMDYHLTAKLWKLYVPLAIGLVVLTFFIGAQRGGADDKAWIMLPGGSISIQPTEFMKIAFILSFSLHLQAVGHKINSVLHVLLLCLHAAVPVLLIHYQGDDGTALVFFVMFLMMLFCSGISWKYIILALLLMAAALPIMWLYVLNDDQRLRFISLFNPGIDPLGIELQQAQARISIGSGRWFGTGLFSGEHRYVPEIQNDFIFTFIGEALGFVGCFAVLLLLVLMCVKILMVGRRSRDLLGRNICIGVFAMLAVQIILNVGMNLSLLPVIGVTLPFFSAGGSSTLTVLMGVGLVQSVYMHNSVGMFDPKNEPLGPVHR